MPIAQRNKFAADSHMPEVGAVEELAYKSMQIIFQAKSRELERFWTSGQSEEAKLFRLCQRLRTPVLKRQSLTGGARDAGINSGRVGEVGSLPRK